MGRRPIFSLFLFVGLALVACDCSEPPPMVDGGMDDAMVPDALPAVEINNPIYVQTMAPSEVRAGDLIMVGCTIIDDVGEVFSSVGRTPVIRVVPEDSVVLEADGYRAVRVGEVEVSCTFPDLMLTDESPATVKIVPGEASRVETRIDQDRVTAGDMVTATCTVFDAFGNLVEDAVATLSSTPESDRNSIEGLTMTPTLTGVYQVACSLPGSEGEPAMLEVNPGLPASLLISRVPDEPVYAIGDVIEVNSVVSDQYGNAISNALLNYRSAPAGTQLGDSRFRYSADGRYVVTVDVSGPTHNDVRLSQSTEIIVNGTGPAIRCGGGGGPADGDMITSTPGTTISFTGQVTDDNDVARVRVNDVDATLNADGSFSAPFQTQFGINFVDVVATDTFGSESSRTCSFLVSNRWASPSSVYGDTITLKMLQQAIDDGNRNDGLDSLNDLLHLVINSSGLRDALHTSLLAANPLKPSGCDRRVFGVCVLRSEIDYLDSTLNGPNTTELSLRNGGLRARIRLENVRVRLDVSGTLDSRGWVTFSSIVVDVDFNARISGGRPRITVVPGSVSSTVGSVDTDFSGLSGFLIDIVVSLAQGTVKNIVSNLVESYVSTNFNSVLDSALGGLDISGLGSTFNVPRLGGGGTIPMSFGVGFTSLSSTTSRLLFGIGTRFTAPSAIARPTLGVAIPPGAIRDDPSTGGRTSAASIHIGMFNQILHALWRGGILEANISGSTLGGSLPAGLSADISGALPPVAFMGADDGNVELGIGALSLDLVYPGLFEQPIRIVLGARASTDVALVAGDLRFSNIVVDELFFSTDDISLDQGTRTVLERFLTTLVQRIVDTALNDALPAIPVPSFTLPNSLNSFGVPLNTELGIRSPSLVKEPQHFVLRGNFGSL